ncbi:MAG: DEAD/DEAH box helicase family protein [Lactobacillus crispatus]|nr:DEAD/DEAH box helicase family protein [Lactobacillus crispatus]
MIPLSGNQKKAIEKLEKLRVGALFMEPGTGKTRTAVELINSSKTDYVLFLVPFQTKKI